MRQKDKWFFLAIILFVKISTGTAQTDLTQAGHVNNHNEVYGGYGIFSFYKIENAAVYNSTQSTGLIFGGYQYHLNNEYSIGILCGAERITPEINNSAEKYYVKRSFALARINKVLVQKEIFELYISVMGGIIKEDKQLINGKETTVEPIYDFVFIGLKYRFKPCFNIFAETGYNRLSVLRCGISVSF